MNYCKLSSHFSRKLCDRGTWNLVCIEYPYGLIYKKNFKFLGRTVSEKNAMTCKISKLFIRANATLFCKLSSHFSRKLCDRGTWNLVCIEYPYGLIYKKNFKFLGRTVSEKNAMLTCKISKLFIIIGYHRMCNFEFHCKLSSHFSRKLCDRGTWNLVCIEYPYGLIYKKNFKFLGRTVSEKKMLTCNISKLFIRANVQLWIFANYHRIFLKNCVTEEHEIWFA